MKELKTLKDLKETIKVLSNWDEPSIDIVYYERLKREAVKWVKSLELKQDHTEYKLQRNPFRYPKPDQEMSEELRKELEGFYDHQIIEWIKHFFNITEEELK